ncbi:MAG: hypothetical protein HKO92_00555 [Flavobacteriaceae bacterium]|nr:hypothetical protein [Flavobacteriaceae bacterium]
MKKLVYLLVGFLLTGTTAIATTTNASHYSSFARGYGNSFIFVEQGIEFAVFPDGQFDFNVDRYGPNFSAYTNFNGVSISFNTGHSYDAYVQYDDFGAVIQIENVPIYYDYYGRISQAGNVHIRYNNRGYVSRVGGLYVHYNRHYVFSHYTGYINVYNRHYVYRPWHSYYVIPRVSLCVLYHRPYRQYYNPYRYTYYRPYRENHRPRVSYNYSRRGHNSKVASTRSYRSERYRQNGPRGEQPTRTVRPNRGDRNELASYTRTRSTANTTTRTRNNTVNSTRNNRINRENASTIRTPRTRENVKSTRTPKSNRSTTVKNNRTPRNTQASISRTRTPNVKAQKPRNNSPKRTVSKTNNRKTSTVTKRPTTSRTSKARVSKARSSKSKASRPSKSRSSKRNRI